VKVSGRATRYFILARGCEEKGRAALKDSHERADEPRRPVGILAAMLALTLTIVIARAGQLFAIRLASQNLQAVSPYDLPIKSLSLTFQRAALANNQVLVMYGSSELYCCERTYPSPLFFGSEPDGFVPFAVGRPGTGDLAFTQMLAAVADELRGRKIVVTASPQWFFFDVGIPDDEYVGNFSPEIADVFTFDSPLSLDLREAVARRMLDYPATLESRPILRHALEDLANPTSLNLLAYGALRPAGRIEAWVQQIRDAYETIKFIQTHADLRANTSMKTNQFDWINLLTQATDLAASQSTTNPFGIRDDGFSYELSLDPPLVHAAMKYFCAGQTNRHNEMFPYDIAWEQRMLSSREWIDLNLAYRTLRELGSEPLVYTVTMPGVFDDFTTTSEPVRQSYYRTYRNITTKYQLSSIDFEPHDEDRFFLNDPGSHLSPRGWVFINRAIDVYWHTSSAEQAQAAINDLANRVPNSPLPVPAAYCGSSVPG
jgi:D-alanine transfer protein